MRRREFIMLIGAAAVWPSAARVQQDERMRRVGILMALGGPEANHLATMTVVPLSEAVGALFQ
jgi:hypothetical protein